MHHPKDRIAHTTAFVTPVVKHWLGRENALTTELHLAHLFVTGAPSSSHWF